MRHHKKIRKPGDPIPGTDFASAEKWYGKGRSEWTDDYYNADAKKGQRRGKQLQGNTVTRSGLKPLPAADLDALWHARDTDPDARRQALEGLAGWIEDRVNWWFTTKVVMHRAGLDVDEAVSMGHEIAAVKFGPAGMKGVPVELYDGGISALILETINLEFLHLIGGRRNAAKHAKEGSEKDAVLDNRTSRDDDGEKMADLHDLLLFTAPADGIGDKPDAVQILLDGRLSGKKHEEIADDLGVSKSAVTRALKKWRERYERHRERLRKS
jgi:hypothetical protein